MGVLSNGSLIAVKQLSSKSRQGNREFINEIGIISALQHPNLVKLYGYCIEGKQLMLIYEFMENNSLANALFGPEKDRLKLDWPARQRICLRIARGLAYLHEETRLKIVHRDIKATNVLLDKHLNAKISDFGLARLSEEDVTVVHSHSFSSFCSVQYWYFWRFKCVSDSQFFESDAGYVGARTMNKCKVEDLLKNPATSDIGGIYYYSERGDRLIDLDAFHEKLWQHLLIIEQTL